MHTGMHLSQCTCKVGEQLWGLDLSLHRGEAGFPCFCCWATHFRLAGSCASESCICLHLSSRCMRLQMRVSHPAPYRSPEDWILSFGFCKHVSTVESRSWQGQESLVSACFLLPYYSVPSASVLWNAPFFSIHPSALSLSLCKEIIYRTGLPLSLSKAGWAQG